MQSELFLSQDAFAYSNVAFEFVSWISAEFKLYIIKDYKRLKSKVDFKNIFLHQGDTK